MNKSNHVILLTLCSSFISVAAAQTASCYLTPQFGVFTCCHATKFISPHQDITFWNPGSNCPPSRNVITFTPVDFCNDNTPALPSTAANEFLDWASITTLCSNAQDNPRPDKQDTVIFNGAVDSICVLPIKQGNSWSFKYLVYRYNNLPGWNGFVETEFADRTVPAQNREKMLSSTPGLDKTNFNAFSQLGNWKAQSKSEGVINFSLAVKDLAGKYGRGPNIVRYWEVTKEDGSGKKRLLTPNACSCVISRLLVVTTALT